MGKNSSFVNGSKNRIWVPIGAALLASVGAALWFCPLASVAWGLVALSLIAAVGAYLFGVTQRRLSGQVQRRTQELVDTQTETNTQLRQAIATLQESEGRLSVTLNSIGDAVLTTDANGLVTGLNPPAELYTGWTMREAVGRPADEVLHFIDQVTRLPAAAPILETLQHGTAQGLASHTAQISLDGTERSIADSCAPICDDEGQVIGAVLVFRDVTKEYAVQQALRDKSALIETILETVVDGIITLNTRDGVVETANPAAERMFGCTAVELIGQKLSDLIPELDRDLRKSDEALEYFKPSAEARAKGLGREVVGRRRDGTLFPLEISVGEMWLGERRHFTGILRDITARKQVEEALLKAGALQKAIFDSANFSSIATDANGVIQIFNVGAEKMLGYTAAEVTGRMSPADISDPKELIARAVVLSTELQTTITPGFEALVFKASRGIEDIYELTYIRKDGSSFPAIVSVTALREPSGGIIGYLLIGTDNSIRKQIEEKLRFTEESFRMMVESVVDYAIIMLDTNGCVQTWNSGAQRIKGYNAEEVVGQHFSRFYPSEEAELGIPQRNLAIAATRGRFEDEGWRRRKDGTTFWASVMVTAIRDQMGALRGFAKLTQDLTQRRKVEAELNKAITMAESANRAKSHFLSSMSHELRSPLNAILGLAQLMDGDPLSQAPSQKENTLQILQAGWHLLTLINEVLDLAKIESGRIPMSLEPVSLTEVIQECKAMIGPQATQRGITLLFPDFDSPNFALADRTRVKQVLLNLLSNALKYNTKHGTVLVECQETTQRHLRISITDTGIGLNTEKLGQLFQAFNRLGQVGSSEEGTGIGLVVAKRLTELMGGTVGVRSTEGVGSTFWFELELAEGPSVGPDEGEMPLVPRPAAPGPSIQRTVLYVEDNPANLRLVKKVLGLHPTIRLLTAVDGGSGIQMVRSNLPDVVLMDINLPDMDGYQALKILRADPKTAHIPVVALSANAMSLDIEKGLNAGFFRYITKPIKLDDFMVSLDIALEFARQQKTAAQMQEVLV